MPRTRSTKGASSAASNAGRTKSSTSRYTLPPEAGNPPKLFVLPKKATSGARVVSLPNPRYSKPTRYLVCPETGIYEFTRISAPKSTPRSWLMEGSAQIPGQDGTSLESQVTKDADLYVASPVDPLFLILPSLSANSSSKSDPPKRMFLSIDDHFDALPELDSHLSEILRWSQVRKLLESRMAAVCDTVDAGDDSMFRLNEKKLVKEILLKAQRTSSNGLPKSMEEKFVRKALEAPIQTLKSTAVLETSVDQSGPSPDTSASTPHVDSIDSQSSVSTVDTAVSFASEASTAATSVADESTVDSTGDVTTAMQASAEVFKLQRLRVAFNFICSSYVPPALAEALKNQLANQKDVDFAPLDDYVARLAKLRQEAMLARSASDFSRKRARDEEDEDRAEKRRKKEEEEKRKKANESRGVRELKKVNVSGMKKLSEFFNKK